VREFQLWTDRRPLVTALFRTFNLIDSSGTWLPSLNSPLTSITCQDRPTWLQTPSVSHPPPPFLRKTTRRQKQHQHLWTLTLLIFRTWPLNRAGRLPNDAAAHRRRQLPQNERQVLGGHRLARRHLNRHLGDAGAAEAPPDGFQSHSQHLTPWQACHTQTRFF